MCDPFAGTGTFLVRLLESGLIRPEDLARKYACELHATEIMLLAYYVAAVNIESTYNALVAERARREELRAAEDVAAGYGLGFGGDPSSESTPPPASAQPEYQPFGGIALADTFQVYEEGDTLDLDVFVENNEAIERQKNTPVQVIVGNPPYSVGQRNANDNNQNVKYPTLDGRIAETYAKLSTATNKNKLYDSYLRAFRWATDRIGDQGIVAFVANSGWIYGKTGEGVRRSLVTEYSHLYVFNLRGNMRSENWRIEGGQIFGAGSQTGIAILLAIKDARINDCTIHYAQTPDGAIRVEKLDLLRKSSAETLNWDTIEPDTHGDWFDKRSVEFETWPVLGAKKDNAVPRYFGNYSLGLATNRDAWAYNYSQSELISNIRRSVSFYNEEMQRVLAALGENLTLSEVKQEINYDNSKFKWNRANQRGIMQGKVLAEDPSGYRKALYRPFVHSHLYFDLKSQLNDQIYQLRFMFPKLEHDNYGFLVTAPMSEADCAILATRDLPNLHTVGSCQFFPRWTWRPVEQAEGELNLGLGSMSAGNPGQEGEVLAGYRRVDNITDEILALYTAALGPVTKEEIFFFLYGQLHDPTYRSRYAADLKKMLPHIETPSSRACFDQLAQAGRRLIELHTEYEELEPYPLTITVKATRSADDPETWRVTTMRWAKKLNPETGKKEPDRTTLIYNGAVTISGIPPEAHNYVLGPRSALEWVVDRYKVRKDKKSGIVNDPNAWGLERGNPRYIVELIGKVTRVSVETMRIVESLGTGEDDEKE